MNKIFNKVSVRTALFFLVMFFLSAGVIFFSKANEAKAENTYSKSISMDNVYQPDYDTGFDLKNPVSISKFGSSELKLESNKEIKQDSFNGVDRYIIKGMGNVNISFYANKNNAQYSNDFKICNDDWKKGVCGGYDIGVVGAGAILILKSYNGYNWQKVYGTTAFLKYQNYYTWYNIFSPSGNDLKDGCYYKFCFMYQLRYRKTVMGFHKTWFHDFIDVYEFYTVASDPSAVAFYNNTTNDSKKEQVQSIDNLTNILNKDAMTTTGFTVDMMGQKYLDTKFLVQYYYGGKYFKEEEITNIKGGEVFPREDDLKEYDYFDFDITIRSRLYPEVEYKTHIIVDRMQEKQALDQFFDGFIVHGDRVYSMSGYPTFMNAFLYAQGMNYKGCPLITLKLMNYQNYEVKTWELTHGDNQVGNFTYKLESGTYEATMIEGDKKCGGDLKKFVFKFSVINAGEEPAPECNIRSLNEYAMSNMSDLNPAYFGVEMLSKNNKVITIAYSEHQDAFETAYILEKSKVVEDSDGNYIYESSKYFSPENYKKVGSNSLSVYELTQALNNNAEKNVRLKYFDISNKETYRTISEEKLSKIAKESKTNNANIFDLSQISLSGDVVLIGEHQREALADDTHLPVISKKPYYFAGLNGESEESGYHDFQFTHDDDGYLSCSIKIEDANNNEFEIEYNKGVAEQLERLGCADGIITIEESNKYGKSINYKAIFLSDYKNTANLIVQIKSGFSNRILNINQKNAKSLNVSKFCLNYAEDMLDQNGIVVIKKKGESKQKIYSAKALRAIKLKNGEYEINCINSLGTSFGIDVKVNNNKEFLISIIALISMFSIVYAIKKTTIYLIMKADKGGKI